MLQWAVVAVVGGFMIFFLIRSITSRTDDAPPLPLLSGATADLTSMTRTIGDIEIDSATRALFPSDIGLRLTSADSLVREGKWPEASSHLRGLLRSANGGDAAAIRAYLGYCYYRSASPDYALAQFRNSFLLADSALPSLTPWLAFSIGYLFQSRGFADSAIGWYEAAHRSPPTGRPALLAAVVNNLGVACEILGDTARAVEMYAQAEAGTDTTENGRSTRTIRDNLARVRRRIRSDN